LILADLVMRAGGQQIYGGNDPRPDLKAFLERRRRDADTVLDDAELTAAARTLSRV
jgi:hypothetical protein